MRRPRSWTRTEAGVLADWQRDNPPMTLKELEAIYWAGTLGSFALAAERLSMTQSSLSKRVLEIEGELGEQLFDRSGPRARITGAGERVLAQARRMLALRDEILMCARGLHSLAGSCRFGVSEQVVSTWLPALVRRVREELPEVSLEPRVGVTQELLSDVVRGETDFALCPGESVDARLASHRLHEVAMTWVSAPGLLAAGGRLDAESLQRVPVISTSAQAGATAALDAWAVAHGIKFRRIVACNSMGAVAALAAAGLGLCVLPAPFAARFLKEGRLERLAIAPELELPPLGYHLHWRQDDDRALSHALRELAIAVGTAPAWPLD